MYSTSMKVCQFFLPISINKTTFPISRFSLYSALDVEDLLSRGQYHEAVLPLPTCDSNSGCRTKITLPGEEDQYMFSLPELFQISGNQVRNYSSNIKGMKN